jgi:hypothetical protein
MGFQAVPTPYYDSLTKKYEIIPVEKLVRFFMSQVPNVYCLVFFASGREIKEFKSNGIAFSATNCIFSFACGPG